MKWRNDHTAWCSCMACVMRRVETKDHLSTCRCHVCAWKRGETQLSN